MSFFAILQMKRDSRHAGGLKNQVHEETRNLDPHPPLRVGLSLTGRGKKGPNPSNRDEVPHLSFLNTGCRGHPCPRRCGTQAGSTLNQLPPSSLPPRPLLL